MARMWFDSFYNDTILDNMTPELAVEIWEAIGYPAEHFTHRSYGYAGDVIVIGDDLWQNMAGFEKETFEYKKERLKGFIQEIQDWLNGNHYIVSVVERTPDGDILEIEGTMGAIPGEEIENYAKEVIQGYLAQEKKAQSDMTMGMR